MRLGTINSNTFQDDDYKLGVVTHTDPKIRQKAIDHHFACIDVMNETGSRDLKIWLADGTNYPGQDDIRARQDRLADSLAKIYERIGEDQRLVLEYKFFEPAFYHTDVPDWGTSYAHTAALGERAFVCLDTGHHAPGTNIEFIVAQLLRLGKLGSFDFNSPLLRRRRPHRGRGRPVPAVPHPGRGHPRRRLTPTPDVAFMLDQCHNIEKKIPGQIRSVLNVQEMTARALLVDREALTTAAGGGDVLGANGILMDAFYTDVRQALAAWRESRGLPGRPDARLRSHPATRRQIEADRVGGTQAGWGWPSDSTRTTRPRRRLDRALEPARRRPAQHELRRRQHLREGHRDRPGHGRAGRAALGEGLRRRPRHADRERARGAAPRPAARARRRLPGRRARGRDGRRVRLQPARQGRRCPVDRHRHARARRRRARRPPAPGLRHRDRDRGRR